MPKVSTVEAKQTNKRTIFSIIDADKLEKNFGNPMRLYDNLKLAFPQSVTLQYLRA